MSLTLRRTQAADPEREAELLPSLDIEALHGLLHERGEVDLAATLLLRLTPEGAQSLAALLARFRRRYSRPSLFRSYTRLLNTTGARRVDLAVAFLRGAGNAGCRVYSNLGDDAMTTNQITAPQHLYALPLPHAQHGDVTPDVESDRKEEPHAFMPPWLSAPRGSSWDR